MKREDVKTKADFFEWLADYMVDGDYVVCEEFKDDVLTFQVYNQCDDLLYLFDEKRGFVDK